MSSRPTDFITTYAWVILIILAAIGVLESFGLIDLSPSRGTCNLAYPMECTYYRVTSEDNQVHLRVKNTLDAGLKNVYISVIGKGANARCNFGEKQIIDVPANGFFSDNFLSFTCEEGLKGDEFIGQIRIIYLEINETQERGVGGELIAKID